MFHNLRVDEFVLNVKTQYIKHLQRELPGHGGSTHHCHEYNTKNPFELEEICKGFPISEIAKTIYGNLDSLVERWQSWSSLSRPATLYFVSDLPSTISLQYVDHVLLDENLVIEDNTAICLDEWYMCTNQERIQWLQRLFSLNKYQLWVCRPSVIWGKATFDERWNQTYLCIDYRESIPVQTNFIPDKWLYVRLLLSVWSDRHHMLHTLTDKYLRSSKTWVLKNIPRVKIVSSFFAPRWCLHIELSELWQSTLHGETVTEEKVTGVHTFDLCNHKQTEVKKTKGETAERIDLTDPQVKARYFSDSS